MFKKLVLIIAFTSFAYPQLKYFGEIGSFQQASSFHINGAGYLFIADAGSDRIFKIDTLGNLLKETGGYGWDAASFDYPSDIFSTTLNVYVSDKKNHRIQSFDKDLNYISSLSTRENGSKDEKFGYPSGCVVNNQGDLFIVDTENKRILKFDLFGNFVMNFGGYEWGKYSLTEPGEIAVDASNNIYVSDNNKIIIYDQFGNGLTVLDVKDKVNGLNIIFNNITLNSEKNIYYADLSAPELKIEKITPNEFDETITSSLVFNNKLYVLTSNKIRIYEFGDLSDK